MTELRLAGSVDSALSHLALVGLAAIVEDRTGVRPRVRWTEEWPSSPVLTSALTPDQVAETVQSHARDHSEAGNWLSLRVNGGPRNGGGLFSARATALAHPEQWRDYLGQRRAALVQLESDVTDPRSGHLPRFRPLDEAMLVALGETAWWLVGVQGRKPDDGGSRWEMADRGSGRDFIASRFCKLAATVAARTVPEVAEGLSGPKIVDELGKGDLSNSRTSTGLTTPAATDNARAWCAFWGIAAAPTVPRLAADRPSLGVSQTAGVWPRNIEDPGHYVLPVFTINTTAGRWSSVLASAQFDHALRGLVSGRTDDSARLWLREQGVRALADFPSRVVRRGPNARPERQLLIGQVHPL